MHFFLRIYINCMFCGISQNIVQCLVPSKLGRTEMLTNHSACQLTGHASDLAYQPGFTFSGLMGIKAAAQPIHPYRRQRYLTAWHSSVTPAGGPLVYNSYECQSAVDGAGDCQMSRRSAARNHSAHNRGGNRASVTNITIYCFKKDLYISVYCLYIRCLNHFDISTQ